MAKRSLIIRSPYANGPKSWTMGMVNPGLFNQSGVQIVDVPSLMVA